MTTNPYKEIDEKFDAMFPPVGNLLPLEYRELMFDMENEAIERRAFARQIAIKSFLHEALASAKEEGRREVVEQMVPLFNDEKITKAFILHKISGIFPPTKE